MAHADEARMPARSQLTIADGHLTKATTMTLAFGLVVRHFPRGHRCLEARKVLPRLRRGLDVRAVR